MQLDKILKKAMIDNNIKGAKQLSEMSEISYNKTIRALNGDGSSRLVDVLKLAETMNLEIKFISKGSDHD